MAISFRDPDGRLLVIDDRVLRLVTKTGAENLNAFLASAVATKFASTGLLARTSLPNADTVNLLSEYLQRQSGTGEPLEAVFEHERITFPSFPYEWAPEMLYRAARLTLDLAESSLIEGFGLKDATPYNVLFRGPQPVFVDLLSFERRDPRDPVWKPYAQFVRAFLLPLLANKYFGLELKQLFLASRDGLEPEEVYSLCGPMQKLRPPFLTLVSIPTWLASKSAKDQSKIYRERRLGSASQARYILERLFKRLRRLLSDIEPRAGRSSEWTDYVSFNKDHAPEYLAEKQAFVEEALRKYKPRNVLDVGCNTGYFSRIAALGGAGVVAIDQDPATIGALWREASASGLNILPLVVDLARPSPSVGWRNGENPSFLSRAQGAFDLVLMLAVVHHMRVSERVPLNEILSLAVDLTRDLLIVEFVAPDDPMFQRLTRGWDHLFRDLTNDAFRDACLQRFDVILCRRLAGAN
ncbi:MAG TPA: class I SAM-dependent methyltransferase, partial [Blastocatellia bacterium]